MFWVPLELKHLCSVKEAGWTRGFKWQFQSYSYGLINQVRYQLICWCSSFGFQTSLWCLQSFLHGRCHCNINHSTSHMSKLYDVVHPSSILARSNASINSKYNPLQHCQPRMLYTTLSPANLQATRVCQPAHPRTTPTNPFHPSFNHTRDRSHSVRQLSQDAHVDA